MKIAKYIFLLLLLLTFALLVFVATQPGDFSFSQTKLIQSDKETLFSKITTYNDYQNWFLQFTQIT